MNKYRASLADGTEKDFFNFIAMDDETSIKIATDCATRVLHWPKGSKIIIDQISGSNEAKTSLTVEEIKASMAAANTNIVGAQREVIHAITQLGKNDEKLQSMLDHWITE